MNGMTEENIRKRVVTSFRKAIDLEQEDNDVEAYQKYLEGLSLVAAALQQDAESSWTAGNPSLSGKERRSLVGFAKQSVDRLVILLDKQDQESSNVIKQTTNTVTDNDEGREQCIPPPDLLPSQNVVSLQSPRFGAVRRRVGEASCNGLEESPMAVMQRENKLLLTRYTTRLQAAGTPTQRHNLQLELERRLTENAAIARQRQIVWEHRRNQVAAQCQQIAEKTFEICDKLENGSITEADFKKQRVFAAALQYEEDNLWLKSLKQDLSFQPQDLKLQRDIINQVLLDRAHPLGSLMCQMQYGVLDKLNPIITKHQLQLSQGKTYSNCNVTDGMHNTLSSLDREMLSSTVEYPLWQGNATDTGAANGNEVGEMFSKEEQNAFLRHFHNIADDIKQDIKMLQTLLFVLFEPLQLSEGHNTTTEMLHQLYFAPVKPYIITLLRLCTMKSELELRASMSARKELMELVPVEDELKRETCAGLHHLVALHSPCQMLDCLVAIMKSLAASGQDDNQPKLFGADDLLPRLMTVVLACGISTLAAETTYMENFMPTDRALGEAGYSLTVLQSILSCLQSHTG